MLCARNAAEKGAFTSICWYGTIITMHSAISTYSRVAMPREPTMPIGMSAAGSLASSAALATVQGGARWGE